jgi:hypothetical protein
MGSLTIKPRTFAGAGTRSAILATAGAGTRLNMDPVLQRLRGDGNPAQESAVYAATELISVFTATLGDTEKQAALKALERHGHVTPAKLLESGGSDGTRTRGLRRDRPAL